MAVIGAGYLRVIDILSDLSYSLFEPIVDTRIISIATAGGFGEGGFGEGGYGEGEGFMLGVNSTASMYAGALVVVGFGLPTEEVTVILEVGPGNQFICNLVNVHNVGEKVYGPTFPVRQPTDPLFTQDEMFAYLSTANNDFLTDCPLVYAISETTQVLWTLQSGFLPSDCIAPARIAYQTPAGPYPLRETSQANLDAYDYRWQENFALQPRAYFRDKTGLLQFGIWPRNNNLSIFEVVYSQRQAQTLQFLDGFLCPDVFVPIIKWRALSFAYSKDGESQSPALAKYWASRYEFGVKTAKMVLESINDPSLELSA